MRCLSRVGLLACPFLLVPLCAQTDLPEGPGRDAVKKICSNCHEIEAVVSTRHTKIGWQQITEDMISRGAEGTDEEIAAVVGYLTAQFGKVNVNTALVAELEKVLGLSEKEARAIAAYRDQHGSIKSFDELEKVPGIDPDKLKAKRSLIAFSQ
jgi:competence ComEA-like helix-hairpin-helix protein